MSDLQEQKYQKVVENMDILTASMEVLERKTKDSAAYRDMNNKLMLIIKFIIVAAASIIIGLGVVVGFAVTSTIDKVSERYFNTTSHRNSDASSESMTAGDSGVIITGDGDNITATTNPTK